MLLGRVLLLQMLSLFLLRHFVVRTHLQAPAFLLESARGLPCLLVLLLHNVPVPLKFSTFLDVIQELAHAHAHIGKDFLLQVGSGVHFIKLYAR